MADDKKKENDKVLPFDELFKQSGDELPIFVGVITEMGLMKRYKTDVAKHKKGKSIKPVVTLKEYQEVKTAFLNKEV